MWHARPIFDDDMDAVLALIAGSDGLDADAAAGLLHSVDRQWDATVVVQDGQIVGCGIYEGDADQGHRYVASQAQDQGIDEWLVRWVSWRSQARG